MRCHIWEALAIRARRDPGQRPAATRNAEPFKAASLGQRLPGSAFRAAPSKQRLKGSASRAAPAGLRPEAAKASSPRYGQRLQGGACYHAARSTRQSLLAAPATLRKARAGIHRRTGACARPPLRSRAPERKQLRGRKPSSCPMFRRNAWFDAESPSAGERCPGGTAPAYRNALGGDQRDP